MKKVTLDDAVKIAEKLNVDFKEMGFTPEEFLEGLEVELEHGKVDPNTNVTDDDLMLTGKIALAHLKEVHTYYHPDIGLESWEHALEEFKGDPKGKKIVIM